MTLSEDAQVVPYKPSFENADGVSHLTAITELSEVEEVLHYRCSVDNAECNL